MPKQDVIAPGMIDRPGIGERVGRRLVGAAENARAEHAARQAARREMTRPALNEATRLLRAAERELSILRTEHAQAAAALLLGEVEEPDVEALEREIADAEVAVRRYEAAAGELEARLGIIRDSTGTIL